METYWTRVTDPVVTSRISMITKRLAAYADRSMPYETRVLSSDHLLAFCIPGGRIYCSTGLIDFCRSDPELAGIIAHEMVHTSEKHPQKQATRNLQLSILPLLAAIATRGEAPVIVMANMVQVGIANAYSKSMERAADLGSFKILQKAGYDPSGLLTVLERFEMEKMKHPFIEPGVYRDHPTLEERIDCLLGHFEDTEVPLHRKGVLQVLHTEVFASDEGYTLHLHHQPLLTLAKSPTHRKQLHRVQDALDHLLQLETPPQEIHISGNPPSLYIGAHRLFDTSRIDLPVPLTVLRERLISILAQVRGEHPMGRYLY
ncbi:MAG: M48 family metallopeptidase [Synergistales bacterium]|nr:M48 family metallopeptidase [Synergistales bacterium]